MNFSSSSAAATRTFFLRFKIVSPFGTLTAPALLPGNRTLLEMPQFLFAFLFVLSISIADETFAEGDFDFQVVFLRFLFRGSQAGNEGS